MYPLFHPIFLALLYFRPSFAQTCNTCQSFGVDFISDGSYFQNSLSTDNFTAVQDFEGCTNDTSHNVLVDPRGKQYECSMTPMSPDDTPEQLTCPITKNQMRSGEWSLLILSNNGDCAPVDYQRDFYLSVGLQQTITVSPTVYITSVVTPIENSTVFTSQTLVSTAPPITTTVPRFTLTPTITIRPLPTITKVTKAILTITRTQLEPTIVATSTRTSKAKCHITRQRHTPDPVANIVATVLGDLNSILSAIGIEGRGAEPTAQADAAAFKRSILAGRSPDAGAESAFLQARRERLAMRQRSPDEPTVTITDSSASPVVSTLLTTAPTQTIFITSTSFITTTSTPVVTIRKGVDVEISAVTAPRRTLTKTIWTIATATTTRTQRATLTVIATSTPAKAAARCSAKGGTIY